MDPRHPTLYRLSADRSSLEIHFVCCQSCGQLTLGQWAYGCRVCGSTDLLATTRPGGGTLKNFVLLFADIVPGLRVPQLIGEVELAPGITEEVLLIGPLERYTPGASVVARPVPCGDGTFECWFEERCSAHAG